MIDYLEKELKKFKDGVLDFWTFDKTTDEIFNYCKIHNIPVGSTLAKDVDSERLIAALSYYDAETNEISVTVGEILRPEIEND